MGHLMREGVRRMGYLGEGWTSHRHSGRLSCVKTSEPDPPVFNNHLFHPLCLARPPIVFNISCLRPRSCPRACDHISKVTVTVTTTHNHLSHVRHKHQLQLNKDLKTFANSCSSNSKERILGLFKLRWLDANKNVETPSAMLLQAWAKQQ